MSTSLTAAQPNGDNMIIGNESVSMKLVQSIYNEITGKVESITRRLRSAHEIVFDDINQLNTKINQLYEQYTIISRNCAVNVYYVNDQKEQFSSFERFKVYDSGSMSPCENITLTYNFLICLPGTNHGQNYTIKINLQSRVGLSRKAALERGLPERFFRFFNSTTGNITIEYVDYTVARNFMIAIDDWYAAIKKNQTSKITKILQRNSEHIAFGFAFLTALTATLIFYFQTGSILSTSPTFNTLFLGIISFVGITFLSSILAMKLGQICEEAVDSYQPLSFISINRGDKKAVTEFKQSNLHHLRVALGSLTGAVIINVISSFIASLIGMAN